MTRVGVEGARRVEQRATEQVGSVGRLERRRRARDTGELDGASAAPSSVEADGEVEPVRSADLVTQELAEGPAVDPADQLADEVAVEERALADGRAAAARAAPPRPARAEAVPVEEQLRGSRLGQGDETDLVREQLAHRGRRAQLRPVPLHGLVEVEQPAVDEDEGGQWP